MRQSKVFSGSSHPELSDKIVERLGMQLGDVALGQFSNGEKSVEIDCSVRNQDVFIVQSGSETINDHLMELLILISACKMGSARRITAVMPYFPYSKQSKMNKQRTAIVGKMVANLLTMAGVAHVITMDLHASQMQGFFSIPVDNLYAEPSLARWIREHIVDWKSCVIVSKNPGGAKRVTSLADSLGVDFALTHMDRQRGGWSPSMTAAGSMEGSMFLSPHDEPDLGPAALDFAAFAEALPGAALPSPRRVNGVNGTGAITPRRVNPEVTTARLISGHVIEEDYLTSPAHRSWELPRSGMGTPTPRSERGDEEMPLHPSTTHHSVSSINGIGQSSGSDREPWGATSGIWGGAGSSGQAERDDVSDDEDDLQILDGLDRTITLVGDVSGRTAIILDDIIDHPAGYIAAAEHLVKNCGAKEVVVMGTHGIFADDGLQELESCECIDTIVVTNTFPIPKEKRQSSSKLQVIDISPVLAEAIRRTHNGESISFLFSHITGYADEG